MERAGRAAVHVELQVAGGVKRVGARKILIPVNHPVVVLIPGADDAGVGGLEDVRQTIQIGIDQNRQGVAQAGAARPTAQGKADDVGHDAKIGAGVVSREIGQDE